MRTYTYIQYVCINAQASLYTMSGFPAAAAVEHYPTVYSLFAICYAGNIEEASPKGHGFNNSMEKRK